MKRRRPVQILLFYPDLLGVGELPDAVDGRLACLLLIGKLKPLFIIAGPDGSPEAIVSAIGQRQSLVGVGGAHHGH